MRVSIPLAVILIAATIWLVGCKSQPAQLDTSSNEAVERDIRAHLPIGSSTKKVLAYLEKRKIEYHWVMPGVRAPGFPETMDPDTGLPRPDTPTVSAFIPVAARGYIVVENGIAVDFKFDATKSRLIGLKVQEILTGP